MLLHSRLGENNEGSSENEFKIQESEERFEDLNTVEEPSNPVIQTEKEVEVNIQQVNIKKIRNICSVPRQFQISMDNKCGGQLDQ